MAYLYNDAADFADEYIAGLVAAHPSRIRAVPGGVARATVSEPNTVAVVIGGGSGHYPAFGGLVGQGLAHGAALGNLFASPSAQQVISVATSVDSGAGVLFCFGNYAGDMLNFRLAADRLAEDGVETRIVAVTDDISSAASDDRSRRRGIAGGLAVYKCAAAAADAGRSLDQVAAIAAKANDRIRTLGVAFSGCTLPGASEPLFVVPAGRMAVGMGIHGEPGISEVEIPTADDLADLFVESLLAELPDGVTAAGQRVVVLLNGLGSVKYEELFVVYRRVRERLEAAGAVIADSEVAELVTSFEMAGASLTLFWLDEELEQLWNAPVDSPAFRRGSVDRTAPLAEAAAVATVAAITPGSEESRAVAVTALAAIAAIRDMTVDRCEELGRLDSVAGDGDHGIGMERGAAAAFAAASLALKAGAGAGSVIGAGGEAWSNRAGGTSGVLWGLALAAVGQAIGDESTPTLTDVARGVRDAADRISAFGHAELGDKTMLDSLLPFADRLENAAGRGESLGAAWEDAAEVATRSAAATADIVAKIGRARPHAEKSIGTPDPGATSFAYAVSAVLAALGEPADSTK